MLSDRLTQVCVTSPEQYGQRFCATAPDRFNTPGIEKAYQIPSALIPREAPVFRGSLLSSSDRADP